MNVNTKVYCIDSNHDAREFIIHTGTVLRIFEESAILEVLITDDEFSSFFPAGLVRPTFEEAKEVVITRLEEETTYLEALIRRYRDTINKVPTLEEVVPETRVYV